MSDNSGQESMSPLGLESAADSYPIIESHDDQPADIREDIGTPLDDEPELNDNAATLSDPNWVEENIRPNSSSAATPTQDDNTSPVDISRIPVPNTGPQFLTFPQPASLVNKDSIEPTDAIGSIPLPQIVDDGGGADIAIVDAISNVNVINSKVNEAVSDEDSDIRNLSDQEIIERDEFGRDMSRRKKKNNEFGFKVVTVEEVSDDDLPEVIEHRTHKEKQRQDHASDVDSNYSMVSNNSLSPENCQISDKEKKAKSDTTIQQNREPTEKDEISSLSGLSSEDEMAKIDRLELMAGHEEIRDLEDGEIKRRRRKDDRNADLSGTNGHGFPSPQRNSGFSRHGSEGGRDSALSERLSQNQLFSNKTHKKRKRSAFEESLALRSEDECLNIPHVRDRQIFAMDKSPNEHGDYDLRLGSNSPNMFDFGRKDASKRTDLPRYDVRNVIERKKKVKSSKSKRGRDSSRSPQSPISKSPVSRMSPRSRSRSLSPRGRMRNSSKSRRKRRNKNKSNNRGHSRSGSRSISPRSYRSYSRSRSKSRSPISQKRRKSKKSGRKNMPRSPSPRSRRIVSPIRRRGRRSFSRSPSYEGASRGFIGSNNRSRYSRSPIRGAVDISPPPTKGRKTRDSFSPKKGKKKSSDALSGTKKTSRTSKKKLKHIHDEMITNSPTDAPNSSKKTKAGKKSNKLEQKGKTKGEKSSANKQSKKKRRDTSNLNDLSMINTHSSSVVEKEVYAAGDKIMVSVNFKSKPKKQSTSSSENIGKEKKDLNASNSKPMVVIDCLASPYQIIEPSPKEVIDIYSDEDDTKNGAASQQNTENTKQTPNKKQKKLKQQKISQQSTTNSIGGSAAVRVDNVTSTVMPRTPSPLLNDARSPSPEDDLSNNVTSTQSISINNLLVAAQQNVLQNPQQTHINNSEHINIGGNLSVSMTEYSSDMLPGTSDKCINGSDRELPSSSMSGQALIHQIQTLSHKGPCTPPPLTALESENFDLMRGPQTPNDDPLDSYDPCDPTESPDLNNDYIMSCAGGTGNNKIGSVQTTSMNGEGRSKKNTNGWATNNMEVATNSNSKDIRADINQNGDFMNNRNNTIASSNRLAQMHQEHESLMKTAAPTIPFLMDDHDAGVGSTKDKENHDWPDKDKSDYPVDMDMDSPFSPQSSEMSDIFEPPLDTPLTNRKMSNAMKRGHKNVPTPAGRQALGGHKHSKSKHNVHMKIVDDKLRIIDDVPSSAVELSVKEKFLKKVQRQERIVEEIKLVLKPHYNRKKISKEDYKDILRKCVPKVCHSKNGDINPLKIQKLVKGYVKKVSYTHKRQPN